MFLKESSFGSFIFCLKWCFVNYLYIDYNYVLWYNSSIAPLNAADIILNYTKS